MARTPYAGRVLIAEVQALTPDATAEWSGEPDGLGVDRVVYFDAETAKWLQPALKLMSDDRIASMMVIVGRRLRVQFDHRSSRADSKSPFFVGPLARMAGVEPVSEPVSEPEPPQQEPASGSDDGAPAGE